MKKPKTSSLYRSVNCWSSLIKTSQEAPKEPENHGDQSKHPPSLLPHILLSRHNQDYQWLLKLLQECSRAPSNKIALSSFLNHLMNLEDLLDPYLLELINLEPQEKVRSKSVPPLSMLFKGDSDASAEGDPQTMKDPKMEEASL